jgi:hypothetical protein
MLKIFILKNEEDIWNKKKRAYGPNSQNLPNG